MGACELSMDWIPLEIPGYIDYKDGYKYQLARAYQLPTPILPPEDIVAEWYRLTKAGVLLIKAGYAWDGASGPTYDSDSSMRGSLVHDVLCQMMREGQLDYNTYSEAVHQFFHDLCVEDDMMQFRAWIWHRAVVFANGGHPDHEDPNPVVRSPKRKRKEEV